jgi:Ohr subfamily peroxiredoxin
MTHTIGKIGELPYTAQVKTTGDRDRGSSQSWDGHLKVQFASPYSAGNGVNPEQLLAAAWSASFASAVEDAAGSKNIHFAFDIVIDAKVTIDLAPDAHLMLAARLEVSLPGLAQETAQMLVDEARALCPCCRATRGNIDVAISVKTTRTATPGS